MEVLVFKTNVTSKKKVSKVSPLLTSYPGIQQWNFDLDDCDKILRVEGRNFTADGIILLLKETGFACAVLE